MLIDASNKGGASPNASRLSQKRRARAPFSRSRKRLARGFGDIRFVGAFGELGAARRLHERTTTLLGDFRVELCRELLFAAVHAGDGGLCELFGEVVVGVRLLHEGDVGFG